MITYINKCIKYTNLAAFFPQLQHGIRCMFYCLAPTTKLKFESKQSKIISKNDEYNHVTGKVVPFTT